MTNCEFHNRRRCPKDYAVWREDMGRYLCDQHYNWHLKFHGKLDKIVKSVLSK